MGIRQFDSVTSHMKTKFLQTKFEEVKNFEDMVLSAEIMLKHKTRNNAF